MKTNLSSVCCRLHSSLQPRKRKIKREITYKLLMSVQSVQSLDRLGRLRNLRDDSAEIVFRSFLQEAPVSSFGRDVLTGMSTL